MCLYKVAMQITRVSKARARLRVWKRSDSCLWTQTRRQLLRWFWVARCCWSVPLKRIWLSGAGCELTEIVPSPVCTWRTRPRNSALVRYRLSAWISSGERQPSPRYQPSPVYYTAGWRLSPSWEGLWVVRCICWCDLCASSPPPVFSTGKKLRFWLDFRPVKHSNGAHYVSM